MRRLPDKFFSRTIRAIVPPKSGGADPSPSQPVHLNFLQSSSSVRDDKLPFGNGDDGMSHFYKTTFLHVTTL